MAAGRQLIDAVVFHAAHMQELAELVVHSMPIADSAADQPEGTDGVESEATAGGSPDQPDGSRPAAEQPRSYLWALFQVFNHSILPCAACPGKSVTPWFQPFP